MQAGGDFSYVTGHPQLYAVWAGHEHEVKHGDERIKWRESLLIFLVLVFHVLNANASFKKKVGELKEQRTRLLTDKSAAESSIKDAEDEVRKIGAEKIDLIRDWGIMVKTIAAAAPVANMELPSFPGNPFAGDTDDHIGPFAAELKNRQEILSQQFNELSDAEAKRDEKQNQIDACNFEEDPWGSSGIVFRKNISRNMDRSPR